MALFGMRLGRVVALEKYCRFVQKNTSFILIQVAVKCVDPDKLIATSSSFLQEASIMTKMRHDNIVRFFSSAYQVLYASTFRFVSMALYLTRNGL